jgi:hypothetical protein
MVILWLTVITSALIFFCLVIENDFTNRKKLGQSYYCPTLVILWKSNENTDFQDQNLYL